MKINRLYSILIAFLFTLAACNQAQDNNSNEAEADNQEVQEQVSEKEEAEEVMEEEMEEISEQLSIPEGARVFFSNIKDGETVASPVHLEFGLEGMEIEPAGKLTQGMGHHHVIIDGSSIERGTVVPTDENNIHFGKGQTEADIEMEAGEHTLTMQFADGLHQSYGEQMSVTITVIVE